MRRHHSLAGPAGKAFTLAEMLVVITIIVIVLAILMPFLGDVQERAYVSICQKNLKEISTAMANSGSKIGGRIPVDQSWVLSASAYGSKEILLCPKGYYRGGGQSVTLNGGAVEIIPAPPSAALRDLESSDKVRMWQEREAFILPTNISANLVKPGSYSSGYGTVQGTIPSGLMVDCYFLHFDPVGSQASTIVDQEITFTDEILGVQCVVAQLDATDPILGSPSTAAYETGVGARGFENNQEFVTISSDKKTFRIDRWYSTSPGEEVRILTRPGGRASYGVNSKVDSVTPRSDQIYIIEYERNTVDIDFAGWKSYIAQRHFGRSNALFVDGSVKLLTPEEFDPATGPWRPAQITH